MWWLIPVGIIVIGGLVVIGRFALKVINALGYWGEDGDG
jgi:hypothetical protein